MVIYKEGPPYYHSLFSLTVIPIQGKNHANISPAIDWQQICGKVRVCRAVHKEPTLCYVILPDDIDDITNTLPNLIEKVSIQCIHLERWPANKLSESNVDGDNDSD